MAKVIADPLDYAAYMRETESQVNVRRASLYADDLVRHFEPKAPGSNNRAARMRSTKLGDLLEFRPGEVTCWAGYNKHRKSTATGQVGLDLCAMHQRVLVCSFEMTPAATIARMARQASGVEIPAPQWLRQFAKWTDGRMWLFDHMGNVDAAHLAGVCRYFAAELMGQHVIVDSMQFVCGSEDDMDPQKEFIQGIIRLARSTGLHIHLVAHCRKPERGDDSRPPGRYDIRGFSAISDQVHNVVMVWANKKRKEAVENGSQDNEVLAQPDAIIRVDAQRNGKFEGSCKLWFHEASMRFMNDRLSPIEPYELQETMQ